MKLLRKTSELFAIVALAAIGAAAFGQPVNAAPYPYHPRGWYEHEREAHRWHRAHVVPAPGVIYAPPPVVYTPPPPPPGINLVIPLDFH